MRHRIKVAFVFFLSFLLWGCGGFNAENTVVLRIDQKDWNLLVPKNWEKGLELPGVLFSIQNQDQNFLIVSNKLKEGEVKTALLERTQKSLFDFELISESETQWQFRGKLGASDPVRIFWQKIQSLSDDGTFLLGTCSYEAAEGKVSDCEAILNSWEEVSKN